MSMRLLIFLILAACGASPAPRFLGAERHEVSRNGRHYVIYQTEKHVEIIRLGYAGRGEHQAIRAEMIGIIPQVTGCTVVASTLQGDSGEMRGRVTCRKR